MHYPILSVMVISHNQAHLIRRCLDSILAQQINAPWEIVISDDASIDNTWDVIQEYVTRYSEYQKYDGYYIPIVRAYQINSSDYNPTVTSDRCAVNKANVYVHAKGKYCVNIDADDYLRSEDIYAYQISLLEEHPECSVAVQNIWYYNDGEPIETGLIWHHNPWKEKEIISFDDYCRRRLFISNPAFMMRRDDNLNPFERYDLLFDDPIISTHHILRGKIICTNRADYIYVQYPNSIWNQVKDDDSDKLIRNLTVYIVYIRYFIKKQHCFLEMEICNWIRILKILLARNKQLMLSNLTYLYVSRLRSKGLKRIIQNDRSYIKFLLYLSLLISRFGCYRGILAIIWNRMIK